MYDTYVAGLWVTPSFVGNLHRSVGKRSTNMVIFSVSDLAGAWAWNMFFRQEIESLRMFSRHSTKGAAARPPAGHLLAADRRKGQGV